MAERKLADFVGRWRIERRIRNAIGPDATFAGEALFTPDKDGLVMREEGEMRVAGQGAMRATREYHWRDSINGLDVYFDDGRFFHHIGAGQQPEDRHDCAPDVYRVAYDFSWWPKWQSVWRVTGPRKDYVMETTFARVGSPISGA